MSTLAQKLTELVAAKRQIRQAIIGKGVSVPSELGLKQYARKIDEISGGGGVSLLTVSNQIENVPKPLPPSVSGIFGSMLEGTIGKRTANIPTPIIIKPFVNVRPTILTSGLISTESTEPTEPTLDAKTIGHIYTENTAGLTLTTSISAKIGKSVVAVVTTRSTTSFSDEWEIVASVLNFGAYTQNLYVLHKIAQSSTESITVTQIASARIYTQLLSFDDLLGLTFFWSYNPGAGQASSISVLNKPLSTSKILWAVSADLWGTGGHWTTFPNDLIAYSSQTITQPRQAAFVDVGTGSIGPRTMTPNGSAGQGVLGIQLEILD